MGILIGEDEAWVTLRRFTLKTLKDFGFGKKGSEIIVQEEADMLCQHFRQFAGKQFEMSTIFNVPVVNVLWQMVISKRFKVSILKVTTLLLTIPSCKLACFDNVFVMKKLSRIMYCMSFAFHSFQAG